MRSNIRARTFWMSITISLLALIVISIISSLFTLPAGINTGVEPVMAESVGYFLPSNVPGIYWAQSGNIWLAPTSTQVRISGTVLHTYFVDANPDVKVSGTSPLDIQVNVLIGNDADQWLEGESAYAQVVYDELYDGIDLHYRFLDGTLKSEYHIQPGSSSETIQVTYDPGVQLSLRNQDRILQVITPDGLTVEEEIPEAYQVVQGQVKSVNVAFELINPNTYTFVVKGTYDPTLPLVIDPVLLFSTYLGGSASDAGWTIARGKDGDTYIGGITQSMDMPLTTAPPANSGNNVFVARLNPQNQLVYITILGGSTGEEANGIGVDDLGNVYVAGETFSTDFPLKNAWQPYFAGYEDAYVAKLDATGALVYSTYIGGSRGDEVDDVYVDAAGNAYLGGEVYSDDYPLLDPWSDNVYGIDEEDGFLSIFNPDGQLIYSTLFSAPQRDQVFQITVDKDGYVYGTGMTSSAGFPLVNAFQTSYGGGWDDCFVFKFDPWNNQMLYSTFLGGNDRDECWGIAVDDQGAAYVAGFTTSTNFPTVNAYQATYGGEYDAFVTKLAPSGNQLLFSTYMGGPQRDMARGVALDGDGNVYVTGMTASPSFLTINALQPSYGGAEDGILLVMSPEGTPLYSSFLGGSAYDRGFDITIDSNWIAHIVGKTESSNFPTQSALHGYKGEADAFISSIGVLPTPTATPLPTPAATPTPYASMEMDSDGGIMWMSWPEHVTILRVPPDVFNVSTEVTLDYELRSSYQGDMMGNDHFFSLNAQPVSGGDPISVFAKPVQLELLYPSPVNNDAWHLYQLDGQTWTTDTFTVTSRSPGYIIADISQTGIYGILGPNLPVFLPLTIRANTPDSP